MCCEIHIITVTHVSQRFIQPIHIRINTRISLILECIQFRTRIAGSQAVILHRLIQCHGIRITVSEFRQTLRRSHIKFIRESDLRCTYRSSFCFHKNNDRDELKQAIALALENDHKVVFEAFVDGHEVECAVIGSDPAVATRPGEILAGAEFYTYDDKYKNGVSQVVIPARLSEEKLDEVKTYAAMAYTALNCEGLARCDFFVEHGTNRVMINEINTFPGFTPISMYPKLMEHEGTPVPALIDHLIELALERTEKQHG